MRWLRVLCALAVTVVLATAAWVAWDYWTKSRANASGDRFSQALTLANEGKNDEAITALEALEADGYGAYPLLARMRAATVLADKGDFDGAVKEFDAVAADTSIPAAIRDMARLRAALVLVTPMLAVTLPVMAVLMAGSVVAAELIGRRPAPGPDGSPPEST